MNHLIWILMAALKFHEHIVKHPLGTCYAIIDHVLGGVNEPTCLIFGDGGNVVTSGNAVIDEDLIAVL